jgi:hypothetical protein
MVEGESIDDFAAPQERPDRILKAFIETGENIDVFTDLDKHVIMPLNNVLLYSSEIDRIIQTKESVGQILRAHLWQYMRLSASKNRASRKEVQGIFSEEEARKRMTIRMDGNNEGALR